jgi:hypothetical protein
MPRCFLCPVFCGRYLSLLLSLSLGSWHEGEVVQTFPVLLPQPLMYHKDGKFLESRCKTLRDKRVVMLLFLQDLEVVGKLPIQPTQKRAIFLTDLLVEIFFTQEFDLTGVEGFELAPKQDS